MLRSTAAGYDTFVVTADVPVSANRENNIRNGFSSPLAITPKVALDIATHPRWLLGTWLRTLKNHGMPYFENMDATRGPPVMSRNLMRNLGLRDTLAWKHVELIRRRWKGKLVVKGMLSPADARIARESGVDGVMVSNHGGRQLDGAVSPLRVLAEIAADAGQMTVMFDGGIRRGTDVLKALALGAKFCFVGRPMLYSRWSPARPACSAPSGSSRKRSAATWRSPGCAVSPRSGRSWCGGSGRAAERKLQLPGCRASARHGAGSLYGHLVYPRRQRIKHLVEHLRIGASALPRHMERMVGVLIELERSALTKRRAHRLELVEARQRVARALEKEHRDPHIGEMLGAFA